jgi:CO/xanthine dehydrogenase Mo-binding subunit
MSDTPNGDRFSARVLTEKEISRQWFLKGAGAVVLGLYAAGAADAATGGALPQHIGTLPPTTATPDATQIDNYLEINSDNTATLYTGWVELGQGTPTALRMIAAEELGLAFDQVKLAPVDTNWSLSAVTAGSTSTKGAFANTSLRGAAAAARTLMLGMAATKLGVPVANLTVSNGVISGGSSQVKYSDLMAGKPFNSTIAAVNPTVTPTSAFKFIGTNIPRQDIPAIVMATQVYTQNVRVPGMLHGRVVRPRGQAALGKGAPVISVDPNSIKHITNAQVVQVGNFLGVVAPKEYDAIQAAAQLKVTWDNTPSLPGSGNLASALRANGGKAVTYVNGVLTGTTIPDAFAVNVGNATAGLQSAAKVVSQSFFSAYNGHVPIGPNCSIAEVDTKNNVATVQCFTQLPYSTRTLVTQAINQTLGLLDQSSPALINNPTASAWQANQVRISFFPASGTYGHSELDDATVAAAIMSTVVGKPVRVQLMRWDETGWDQLGPAQVTDISAGIDGSGNIVAYQYQSFQHGSMSVESSADLAGVKLPLTEPTGSADATSSASYYDKIPNRVVLSKKVGSYHGFLKGTYLRAPAAPQSLFASEQVIDALAQAAGMDPIAFRLQNMTTDPNAGATGLQGSRWAAVLQAVAQAANWKPGVTASNIGTGNVVSGRGVAIGGFSNARPAVIADITVNKQTGKISVSHLYCAMDLGTAINPAMVENQMEGSLVMGASRALQEATAFTSVRQTSLDWVTYPILRFKDSPKVTTVLLQRFDQAPDGAGEPAEAPVPAAIGNAFFDATGVRLTQMPMSPAQVRAALKAAK